MYLKTINMMPALSPVICVFCKKPNATIRNPMCGCAFCEPCLVNKCNTVEKSYGKILMECPHMISIQPALLKGIPEITDEFLNCVFGSISDSGGREPTLCNHKKHDGSTCGKTFDYCSAISDCPTCEECVTVAIYKRLDDASENNKRLDYMGCECGNAFDYCTVKMISPELYCNLAPNCMMCKSKKADYLNTKLCYCSYCHDCLLAYMDYVIYTAHKEFKDLMCPACNKFMLSVRVLISMPKYCTILRKDLALEIYEELEILTTEAEKNAQNAPSQ